MARFHVVFPRSVRGVHEFPNEAGCCVDVLCYQLSKTLRVGFKWESCTYFCKIRLWKGQCAWNNAPVPWACNYLDFSVRRWKKKTTNRKCDFISLILKSVGFNCTNCIFPFLMTFAHTIVLVEACIQKRFCIFNYELECSSWLCRAVWEVTVALCCIRNTTIDFSRWGKCGYSMHTHCVPQFRAPGGTCLYVPGKEIVV